MDIKFAERFKELRLEMHLTQNEIGAQIGVTQSTIAKWEKGDIEPSFIVFVKICRYFKTSSDYLLGLED